MSVFTIKLCWFIIFFILCGCIALADNCESSVKNIILIIWGFYIASSCYLFLRFSKKVEKNMVLKILLYFLFFLTILGSLVIMFSLFV